MAEGICRQPGVPKKGWTWERAYDSCEDGEDLHRLCQWCGHKQIRYVHVLTHEEHPKEIEVGVYCAGLLGLEYVAGRAEKSLHSRVRRRPNWLAHSGWRPGGKPGYEKIKVDGVRMGVFTKGSGRWNFWYGLGPDQHWGPGNLSNVDAAKLALFEFHMDRLDERD